MPSKIPTRENLWQPIPTDHALHLDGFRWQKLGLDGEPEIFATHPPEALLEGMCRAVGLDIGATQPAN